MQDTQTYRRPTRAQAQRVRPAIPKRGREVNWRRRLAVVLIVILTGVVAAGAFVVQRAISFNDAVSTASALSMRIFGPFSPERVNVLFLGYSDESWGGAFLSDSMNILSVDKGSGTTTMIPIPRDLWVEGFAEVPQNMKINEAFRIGYYADGIEAGADLASKAVTYATGLRIDGWISLDFQGFEAMVDAIGGVAVDNPTAFAYAWAEEDYAAANFPDSFESGTLLLDGQRALDYARSRYTSVAAESSDFARSVRQQRILGAIRSKIAGWEAVPKGLALSDALADHLDTNLPVLDLAFLAGKLTPDRRLELAEGQILEATTNTIGQYVLAVIGRSSSVDYEPLHRYLAEALDESADEAGGGIEPQQ